MEYPIIHITEQQQLDELVQKWMHYDKLYLDLEFDKNHYRYGFQLCLMQLYDGDVCYLIDPFGNLEINTIFPVLNASSCQLVCFSSDEDMRLLYHIGAHPVNIFDIGIGLKLLDHPQLSLDNAIATVLGDDFLKDEPKSQQMSNWFLRPITKEQEKYAATDVLFLPQLQEAVCQQLAEKNRTHWMEQEMQAYEKRDWDVGSDVLSFSYKERKQFTLQEWIRYEHLMIYREELAEMLDRPSYKVWDKRYVAELCQHPEKVHNWMKDKGKHPKLKTPEVKQKIERLLEQADQEIKENKINQNTPAAKAFTKKEDIFQRKEKRKRQDFYKDTFFTPNKKKISQVYGINFSNYFLSNKRTLLYIDGTLKLLPYQQKLLIDFARDLELPLPDFVK